MVYFVYLSSCQHLLHDPSFIMIFNFNAINHIISLKQSPLLIWTFLLEVQPQVLLSFGLIFCQFWHSAAYESVAYKKMCI